jgi:hypothetical protein
MEDQKMELRELIEKALEAVETAYNETDYNTKECRVLNECLDLLKELTD